MTLVNQHWITLSGDPVTGRVPPTMVVYAPPGVMPNAGQLGGALHAYKTFCDAISVSGIEGCATMTSGLTQIDEIGVKSLMGS